MGFLWQNRQVASLLVVLLLVTGLLACSSKKAASPEPRDPTLPIQWLEISVSYGDGSFLPSGSVLTLTLEDVSSTYGSAKFLGETVKDVEGEPPYLTSLGYNPEMIQDNGTYSLRAEIRHYDRLLYTNAARLNPFEKETSTPVPLPVIRVPRPRDTGTEAE